MGVRMSHPDLPGQDIEVAASAVPFHVEAGWSEVPDQDERGEQWPAEAQPFGGQPVVRLRHPDLDAEIEVAASAVPFHRDKGWVLVEEVEAAELDGKTVEELREIAGQRGLRKSGNKDDLLARLRGEQEQDTKAGDEPAQPSQDEEA